MYFRNQALAPKDPKYKQERKGDLIRIVGPGSGASENQVFVLGTPKLEEFQKLILEQIAYFKSLGKKFEWKYFSTQGDAIKPFFLQQGFQAGENEILMVFDLKKKPLPKEETQFTYRELSTAEDFKAIARHQEALHKTDLAWLATSLQNEKRIYPFLLEIYGAFDGKKLVATGWIRFKDSGFLYGGATLPEYRNRGIYRTLVAKRLKSTKDRGFNLVFTESAPMSQPILKKLGFEPLLETIPYVLK